MALKFVGSGLGRTGSFSLKLALEQLGFGPCHHMIEVFGHPETMPLWVAAGQGKPDWDAIFEGYVSAVDYPTAGYWREIAAHFPDAKVIHCERDPDGWFESTQATIFAPSSFVDNPPEPFREFFQGFLGDMADHIHDRAFMTEHFRRNSAAVRATIAPERLFVMQVGEGWERLCAFLGVPVPDTPYPRENTREQFQARAPALQAGARP